MMARLWIVLHLLWLSAEDIQEGQLSMPVILELGIAGAIHGICTGGRLSPGIGLCLLFTGYLSRERIGYGDGWLMLALGMWMTLPELLQMFFWGLILGMIYGVAAEKEEIPLVPFLGAAYLMKEWI